METLEAIVGWLGGHPAAVFGFLGVLVGGLLTAVSDLGVARKTAVYQHNMHWIPQQRDYVIRLLAAADELGSMLSKVRSDWAAASSLADGATLELTAALKERRDAAAAAWRRVHAEATIYGTAEIKQEIAHMDRLRAHANRSQVEGDLDAFTANVDAIYKDSLSGLRKATSIAALENDLEVLRAIGGVRSLWARRRVKKSIKAKRLRYRDHVAKKRRTPVDPDDGEGARGFLARALSHLTRPDTN
ncbi:hypothetical protein [Demequina rhizosphaerae]|uniref:hypothetical protein n=1 Tax=Demequina rhizosphaerae TaxID=1638985 RepID=UPI000782436C|nr:hypothetical protein [Demequina rhizosphaerae]